MPRPGYGGRVEKWRISSIRSKRGRLRSGRYVCPYCSEENLRIRVDKKTENVEVKCSCGFGTNLSFVSHFELIDYYNQLIDHLGKSASNM